MHVYMYVCVCVCEDWMQEAEDDAKVFQIKDIFDHLIKRIPVIEVL